MSAVAVPVLTSAPMDKGLQIQFIEEVVDGFSSEMNEILHRRARKDSFLARIPQITHLHGTQTSMVDVQGHTWPGELERITIESQCSFDVIEAGIPHEFQAHLHRTIEKLKQDLLKMFYLRIDKITDATGNVFDGRQYKSKADALCAIIERMPLDFDGGKFEQLEIHCSPEQAKEFEETLNDPSVGFRLSSILIQKYFERFIIS